MIQFLLTQIAKIKAAVSGESEQISTLNDTIATEQSSVTISTLKYKVLGDMMLVSGVIPGDGTSEIATGLGNYIGTLNARNSSTGIMALYLHQNNKITGWDGSTSRKFTENQNYLVNGVLYKQS